MLCSRMVGKCPLLFTITVLSLWSPVCLCVFVNDGEVAGCPGSRLQFRDDMQCFSTTSEPDDNRTALYFLVVAPYPDSFPFSPSWRGGPAVVPAAIVAKDLLNSRSDILVDYRIEVIIDDSGCNQTSKAVNSLLSGLFCSGRNVVGIIGPGCSEAALAIAPLITDDRISLIQIAPSVTSPDFTNTTLYPNTFRPTVSALGFVDTYIEMIRRKSYRRVGALYEANRPFQTTVYTRFEEKALKEGVQLTAFGVLGNGHFPLVEFRSEVRVIFVFASSGIASRLLCLAYHKEMLYPDYQFVFSNRKPNNFLKDVNVSIDGVKYRCNSSNMKRAIVGMIFNDFRLTRRDRNSTNTDPEVSYNEFDTRYTDIRSCHVKSLGLSESDIVTTEHHSGYFDATWALALSLNNSLPRLQKEKGLSLSNYTYQMPEITRVIKEELLKLSFEGMRGRIEFSNETHDGANVTLIDMYQVFDSGGDTGPINELVGFYTPNRSDEQSLVLFDTATLIPSEFDKTYVIPNVSLGVITMMSVVILFVALFACHIANVLWASYKSVKATSPNLNHLIFSGCYLALIGAIVYTSAFVFITDISESSKVVIPVHCSALQWASTMTFSLVIGTLGAKTWRIHRIFNQFNAVPMKRLSDKILIPIALIPLAVDIVLNILWNTINPWYLSIEDGPNMSLEATCRTDNQLPWTISIAFPKVVLTLIVLYLSIATRRVHRKEFRHTKSINILIYSLLILTGILLPLFFILHIIDVSSWSVSLRYFIFCLFDLAYVVLCILLVLLPPLIPPIRQKFERWRIKSKDFNRNLVF